MKTLKEEIRKNAGVNQLNEVFGNSSGVSSMFKVEKKDAEKIRNEVLPAIMKLEQVLSKINAPVVKKELMNLRKIKTVLNGIIGNTVGQSFIKR